ncbi:MAG: hypothetical protein ACOC8C_01700 [Chloroflexota bacterium]
MTQTGTQPECEPDRPRNEVKLAQSEAGEDVRLTVEQNPRTFRVYYNRFLGLQVLLTLLDREDSAVRGVTLERCLELISRRFKRHGESGTTHVFVRELEANTKDNVFRMMQGEYWSPDPETRAKIERLGLHTSLSVGDVVEDKEGRCWLCMPFGWREIEDASS